MSISNCQRGFLTDIQHLIQTHGAARYLATLRDRYRAGHYTWHAFALRAASAYLADNKPLRAEALLDTLEAESLSPHELDRFAILLGQIRRCPALPHPDCSLNMIVRDEAANITEALDTADTCFDEIVICDTGSTDDTAARARAYGARIVSHPWDNDFSRARNAALNASRCEWVFWMDADDRLEKRSAQALVRLWRKNRREAFAITVANRIGNGPPVEFLQVRLFPRGNGVRFERRIHEQVMFSLKRHNIPIVRCEHVRVMHTGYRDPETHRRKALRNQRLIEQEIRARPDDTSLLFALADSYFTLGRTEQARAAYRSLCGREEAYEMNPDTFTQAHVNVGMLEFGRGNLYEAKRYFYRSLYLDSKRLESWYCLGRIALKQGREKTAAAYFVRGAGPLPQVRMTAVNNTIVRLESLYYLSELLLKWGYFAETEDLLKSALIQYPMVPRFYTQIGRAHLLRSRMRDAAEYFMQSITLCPRKNEEAYIGMAEVYVSIGDTDSAMRFLGRALKNGGNAVKIQAAVDTIQQIMAGTPAPEMSR